MNILIAGSSGFVGTNLTRFLIQSGHEITGIDATVPKTYFDNSSFQFIQADTSEPGEWQHALKHYDVIINLAGKNIFNRWSEKYKKIIYDSRIFTTRHIVDALPQGNDIIFVSTSAIGFYGDRGDKVLTETMTAGNDFLARVCVDWEKEASRAAGKGTRVVMARFSVVLGKKGGALAKMIPAYRMFVGGPLGSGKQWFSWIQLNDLMRAIQFAIDEPKLYGPVNFCSPKPVRNKDFSSKLAGKLGRPAIFRVPAPMLRLAAGELGDLVLNSQRGYPDKLVSAGFQFEYADLDEALAASIT